MATKQINQLTAATAIEDTDSIPLQTLGGVTKRFTPAILKDNLDGRYQQLGTIIWEEANGAQEATGLTFTTGKVYEVYITAYISDGGTHSGMKIVKFLISHPISHVAVSYFDDYIIDIAHDSLFVSASTGLISGGIVKIYKIVEYEV